MSYFAPQSFSTLINERDSEHISSNDLVKSTKERIAAIERTIEAFAYVKSDSEVTTALPLSGIAIGIKDIFDTYDMPTKYGSTIYENHQPRVDSALVAMCRAKGATIIGKTVTTEFAFLHPSNTKNPHNLSHNPGGSSAGSAAAVASGMVPIATGTQTGGSIIRPASYCGICGFKPSYRLLPTVGIKYFAQNLDTSGFFSKTTQDMALFLELLTDRTMSVETVEPADIKIGFYQHKIDKLADNSMQAALSKTIDALSDAGFQILEIDEPQELSDALDIHPVVQNFEAAQNLASDYVLFKDQMSSELLSAIEVGAEIRPQQYDKARRTAKIARRKTGELFQKVDVILTPSATGTAPIGFESTGDPTFNKLWTLMGNPAVNIPGLYDEADMPLGIQAIGRFGADRALLSVAHAIESVINSN